MLKYKTPLLFLLLLVSNLNVFGQEEKYINYANNFPYLNTVNTIVTYPKTCNQSNCSGDPSQDPKIDYITAHTAIIDSIPSHDGGQFLKDRAIVISLVKKVPGNNCEILHNNIDQFIINIAEPFEMGFPDPVNLEFVHSLKIDENLNLIGCGYFSAPFFCQSSSLYVVESWPFYFKYDLCNNSMIWFKKLWSQDQGACGVPMPLNTTAIDIEVLNGTEYVIALSGPESGLLKVNASNGAILDAKQYHYQGYELSFNDIEVMRDSGKILAVETYDYNLIGTDIPAMSILNNNLESQTLMKYGRNFPFPFEAHDIRPSAVKYNPETQSALIAAHNPEDQPFVYGIRISDFVQGTPDWYQSIALTDNDLDLTATFGVEYLRGLGRFVIHGMGNNPLSTGPGEGLGLPGGSGGTQRNYFQFLIDIEDASGNLVAINKLDGPFEKDEHNQPLINNTLVQSYRNDHLGLVLHNNIANSAPTDILHLLMTDKHSNNPAQLTACTVPHAHSTQEDYSTELIDITYTNFEFSENDHLIEITEDFIFYEELCTSSGGGLFRSDEVSDLQKTGSLEVYPNPGRGFFRIEIGTDFKLEHGTLGIYDMLQQKVYGMSALENNSFDLNLSHLSPGLYNLIIDNGREFINKKLIIQ